MALEAAGHAGVAKDVRVGEVHKQLVMSRGMTGDIRGALQLCDIAMQDGFYEDVTDLRDYTIRQLKGGDPTVDVANAAYLQSLQQPVGVAEFTGKIRRFFDVVRRDKKWPVPAAADGAEDFNKWRGRTADQLSLEYGQNQGELLDLLRADFRTYERPWVLSAEFSPEECDALIVHMAQQKEKKGALNEDDSLVFPTMKTNQVYQLPQFTGEGPSTKNMAPAAIAPILRRLNDLVLESNRLMWNFARVLMPPRQIEMAVYNANESGHYAWHTDVSLQSCNGHDDCDFNFHTTLSFSLLLSDPSTYDGGQLFIQGRIYDRLPRGTLVVFPSYLLHEVRNMRRGSRQALVGFVQGRSGPIRGPPYFQLAQRSYYALMEESPTLCGTYYEASFMLMMYGTSAKNKEAENLLRKCLQQPTCTAPAIGWLPTEEHEKLRAAQRAAQSQIYCPTVFFGDISDPGLSDVCLGWQRPDEIWNLLAFVHHRQGQYQAAVHAAKAAVKWQPKDRKDGAFRDNLKRFEQELLKQETAWRSEL